MATLQLPAKIAMNLLDRPRRTVVYDAVFETRLLHNAHPRAREVAPLKVVDSSLNVRRIILHTCRVGYQRGFMQLVADRLQVAVRSHRHQVDYVGGAGSGHIAAHYAGRSIVRPRDERQWPVSRLSAPVYPGDPPKRW